MIPNLFPPLKRGSALSPGVVIVSGVIAPSKLAQSATLDKDSVSMKAAFNFICSLYGGAVILSQWFILSTRSRGRRVDVTDETRKQLVIRALQ